LPLPPLAWSFAHLPLCRSPPLVYVHPWAESSLLAVIETEMLVGAVMVSSTLQNAPPVAARVPGAGAGHVRVGHQLGRRERARRDQARHRQRNGKTARSPHHRVRRCLGSAPMRDAPAWGPVYLGVYAP
jgi:hypothetical protein